MMNKKFCLGEPDVGSEYGIEELNALLREFEDFTFDNAHYDPRKQIKLFENNFAKYIGTKHAISVNSGMSALEIILYACFGDKSVSIISNAINFHGTHLSVLNQNNDLFLCDSDSDLNVNYDKLFQIVNENKPDALLLTNMNGLPHDELKIKSYLSKVSPNTILIIDCCRSLGSKCRGEKSGKNADVAFFSFQRKKQITTLGEGGMIVTNNSELALKCEQIRSFGFGVQKGANYKLTSFQARVGIEQLNKIDFFNHRRREIAQRRTDFLKKRLKDFVFPKDNKILYNTYYLYSMLVPKRWNSQDRDNLIKILSDKFQIGCVIANDVTYKSSEFLNKNISIRCYESEKIADRIVCPIIHPSLSDNEEKYINESIVKAVYFVEKNKKSGQE